MYHKILVPMALDHGLSPQTLEIARALCAPGAQIVALHVYEMPQGMASAYLDKEAVNAGYARAEATLKEKLAATPEVTPVIIEGHTARDITEYARAQGVDCIVIGSHKPGLSDYFLGSTAAWVVRHAPAAVHVHRNG